MPTDASFRFSTYLTLALACVALGYAEFVLFPEVAAFATLAVAGLGALYFLESRVTFLSIPAANRLGLAVGLVYVMWAAYRVKREMDTAEFINMGWPMLIVAMSGPLVMLVIVAKVARSDKHAGDYWWLHGAALAGVALSAAFAEEALSFVLVGLYLVAAVWSLTLLHLGRASGTVPPIPGGRQPATKTVAVSADPTGHRTDLRPAALWALLALVVAVPIYLLTPRSEAAKAELGKPRIEIGYAADQMVDLNRTGPLKANSEVAFEFTATYPDGRPKTDINPEQRWWGKALRHYSGGEWKSRPEELLPHVTHAAGPWRPGQEPALAQRGEAWSPPNLGPEQYTLGFEVPARLHTSFLADPVQWVPRQHPPVAFITEAGPRGWLPVADGTFYWEPRRGAPRRYLQAHAPRPDPDAAPPIRFTRGDHEVALLPLRHNPVPRVKEYAERVLKELQARGELPRDKELRSEENDLPHPRFHDKIARAFAAHLATTPELSYTTDLRRENKNIDPIEDFLFHSKAGHCERFATALVLMLRSQGIPAMFVLGFKGCEHVESGRYLVRQEHAHAWVQALVPVPGQPEPPRPEPGRPSERVYHWLSLDPTPGAGRADAETRNSWWQRAGNWIEERFDEYMANYTSEQRRKALAAFAARLTRVETLASGALVVALLLGGRHAVRRVRRAREAPPAPVAPARWFTELVALLAAHGITPRPGDTPREFAAAASESLRERGHTEVAEVPLAWAEAYYQDRYGGVPPSDARMAELEAGLDALRQSLANRGS